MYVYNVRHILSVAAVWTGVCGVSQFCVPSLSNKKSVLTLGSNVYIWLDTMCVLGVCVRVTA